MQAGPALRVMGLFMNDYGWAAFYGFAWALQSLAMCGNHLLLRRAAAVVSGTGWIILAAVTGIGNPLTPGAGMHSILALAMIWIYCSVPK